MFKKTNICILLAIILYSSFLFHISSAEQAKKDTQVFHLVTQYLEEIGYDKKAERLTNSIKQVFPKLNSLLLIPDKEVRMRKLILLIKEKIDPKLNVYDLQEVLTDKEANCFGYSQLVYILGNSVGLNMKVVNVYPDHVANLFKINSKYRILDLSSPYFFISDLFSLEKEYVERSKTRRLKTGSVLPHLFRIIQIVDSKGINAMKHYAQATKNFEMGKYERAIKEYNKAIELNPFDAHAYNGRGESRSNLDKLEEAMADFNKALKFAPDYSTSYYERGNLRLKLGEYKDAIEDYDKAILLAPNNIDAYYNRGNAEMNLGKYKEAKEDYSKAIKINPDFGDAYYARGVIKSCLGRNAEAIKDYNQGIKFGIKFAEMSDVYNDLGIAEGEIGKYKRALKNFNQAIAFNSKNAEVYYNRGYVYLLLKKYKKAIENYNKSLLYYAGNLNKSGIYYWRGMAKYRLGNLNKAVKDFNKAIELDLGKFDKLPSEIKKIIEKNN